MRPVYLRSKGLEAWKFLEPSFSDSKIEMIIGLESPGTIVTG
jgi:hypothetical protein